MAIAFPELALGAQKAAQDTLREIDSIDQHMLKFLLHAQAQNILVHLFSIPSARSRILTLPESEKRNAMLVLLDVSFRIFNFNSRRTYLNLIKSIAGISFTRVGRGNINGSSSLDDF